MENDILFILGMIFTFLNLIFFIIGLFIKLRRKGRLYFVLTFLTITAINIIIQILNIIKILGEQQ